MRKLENGNTLPVEKHISSFRFTTTLNEKENLGGGKLSDNFRSNDIVCIYSASFGIYSHRHRRAGVNMEASACLGRRKSLRYPEQKDIDILYRKNHF